MDQPIGFVTKGQEHKVCKLKRSIYGLKQSSRQWYLRFHRAILSNGFTMIEEDHYVYIKRLLMPNFANPYPKAHEEESPIKSKAQIPLYKR